MSSHHCGRFRYNNFLSKHLFYICTLIIFSRKKYNYYFGGIYFYVSAWRGHGLAGFLNFSHSIIVHIIWEKPAHSKRTCSSNPVNVEVTERNSWRYFVCFVLFGVCLLWNPAFFSYFLSLVIRITKFSF